MTLIHLSGIAGLIVAVLVIATPSEVFRGRFFKETFIKFHVPIFTRSGIIFVTDVRLRDSHTLTFDALEAPTKDGEFLKEKTVVHDGTGQVVSLLQLEAPIAVSI